MFNTILLWSLLLFPWLSLFFMNRRSIKRFMPVSIFVALLLSIIYEIAFIYEWWEIKESILPWGKITNPSYVYGTFLVGTIWIFYFTYQSFWLFIVTNLVVDALFSFGFLKWMEMLGMHEMKNLSEFQAFLIMTALSFIIYFYQRWQEEAFVDRSS